MNETKLQVSHENSGKKMAVIVLGDYGVGKTVLLGKYLYIEYLPSYSYFMSY